MVDDGSTDDTVARVRAYPVTLLRHEHDRGTSAARDSGWRAARAAVIAFVDADVVVRPGALARMPRR